VLLCLGVGETGGVIVERLLSFLVLMAVVCESGNHTNQQICQLLHVVAEDWPGQQMSGWKCRPFHQSESSIHALNQSEFLWHIFSRSLRIFASRPNLIESSAGIDQIC